MGFRVKSSGLILATWFVVATVCPSVGLAQDSDYQLRLPTLTEEAGVTQHVLVDLENNGESVEAFEFDVCFDGELVALQTDCILLGADVEELTTESVIIDVDGDAFSIAVALDIAVDVLPADSVLEVTEALFDLLEEGTADFEFCGVLVEPKVTVDAESIEPEVVKGSIVITPEEGVSDPDYVLSVSSTSIATPTDSTAEVDVSFNILSDVDARSFTFGLCHNETLVSLSSDDVEYGDALEGTESLFHSVTVHDAGVTAAYVSTALNGLPVLSFGENQLYRLTYTALEDNGTCDLVFCEELPGSSRTVIADVVLLPSVENGGIVLGDGINTEPDPPDDPAIELPALVKSYQKISQTEGNLGVEWGDGPFGYQATGLGDVDGDGIPDIAASMNDGSDQRVIVMLLASDGSVRDYAELENEVESPPGFPPMPTQNGWGIEVSDLGDFDDDGVPDLLVGSTGAVHIMYLNDDGTKDDLVSIGEDSGGFGGALDDGGGFGHAACALGDVDGDGITEIAVGEWKSDDGGENRGRVWILFMNDDGTVDDETSISDVDGAFQGDLDDGDFFGRGLAPIGDLDGNGVPDLAVGAPGDELDGPGGGFQYGAIYIVFLDEDGGMLDYTKIAQDEGGFEGQLGELYSLGDNIALIHDIDGDGAREIASGTVSHDDGGIAHGAVWIFFLNIDGTVKRHALISDREGGFEADLDDFDYFGADVGLIGDVDGDDIPDLVASAPRDGDGEENAGAVYVLFMDNLPDEPFLRGDVDANGAVFPLLDAIYLMEWGFVDGDSPPCMDAADVDDSGTVFPLVDALYLLAWGFGLGGAPPPDPGPDECGPDSGAPVCGSAPDPDLADDLTCLGDTNCP